MESMILYQLPCRLCEGVAEEKGVRISSTVAKEKLSEWWQLHLGTQLEYEDRLEQEVWICYSCTLKSQKEHEHEYSNLVNAGHTNCDWWTNSVLEGPAYLGFQQDQEQNLPINDAIKEEPPVDQRGEELQAPKGAFEEESTLEDVKLSLRWRLKECKKLQKEKEEILEILTGQLESMQQRLNGAVEAKSKAENTIKELNDQISYLEAQKKNGVNGESEKEKSVLKIVRHANKEWESQILLHSPEKSTDIEDDKEPIKKVSTSKAVVDIPREQPKPLKMCATDPTKYELCPDFLVSKEKVDSLPENVTLSTFVGKLMEYHYRNSKEANEHLSKFSLMGKSNGRKAKPMYPFRNALFDAANLKFEASQRDIAIAITRKLNKAQNYAVAGK